jgi:hypothetical protein
LEASVFVPTKASTGLELTEQVLAMPDEHMLRCFARIVKGLVAVMISRSRASRVRSPVA